MKVVMRDIADALGISIVSVSKSLNDQVGVSDKLRETVKNKALEMGYRGAILKNSTPEKTNCMAVVIPQRFIDRDNNNQGFYLDFYQLITVFNQENNISTLLYVLSKEEENTLVLPRVLLDRRVDYVVFLAELKTEYLHFVKDIVTPKVFLDFFGQNINIDCVTTDNYSGSYEATSELILKGHSSIGFIGNIAATTSIQDRFLGYQKALFENKISFNPLFLTPDRDEDGHYTEIVLPSILPTAFVCNSDRAAFELSKTLKERGLVIPDDVSVVGFDNDIYSRVSIPTITTVEVSKEQMVKSACEFLYSKFNNKDTTLGKVTIKGNLVRRKSIKDLNLYD